MSKANSYHRLLRSGDAYFAWDFSVLRLPKPEDDREGMRVLHEFSHVLTFAGTDFYMNLASQILKGEEPTYGIKSFDVKTIAGAQELKRRQRSFSDFAEAVPEALRLLGENIYEGTLAKAELARALADCTELYRSRYGEMWSRYGVTATSAWGAVAGPTDLDPERLHSRFILLTIAHAILAASNFGELGKRTFEQNILDLLGELSSNKLGAKPSADSTIAEHVQLLLGIGPRIKTTMFNDHFSLIDVLASSSDNLMHQHIGLLPVVVGLEFTIEVWPEGIKATMFGNENSQPLRRRSHLFRRLRDDPARNRLGAALAELQGAFQPRYKGLPVHLPESRADDPVARSRLAMWTVHSFLQALPKFCSYLLQETPMFSDKHYQERLDWLEATTSEGLESFLANASSTLNLPILNIPLDKEGLKKGEHVRKGDVWILAK